MLFLVLVAHQANQVQAMNAARKIMLETTEQIANNFGSFKVLKPAGGAAGEVAEESGNALRLSLKNTESLLTPTTASTALSNQSVKVVGSASSRAAKLMKEINAKIKAIGKKINEWVAAINNALSKGASRQEIAKFKTTANKLQNKIMDARSLVPTNTSIDPQIRNSINMEMKSMDQFVSRKTKELEKIEKIEEIKKLKQAEEIEKLKQAEELKKAAKELEEKALESIKDIISNPSNSLDNRANNARAFINAKLEEKGTALTKSMKDSITDLMKNFNTELDDEITTLKKQMTEAYKELAKNPAWELDYTLKQNINDIGNYTTLLERKKATNTDYVDLLNLLDNKNNEIEFARKVKDKRTLIAEKMKNLTDDIEIAQKKLQTSTNAISRIKNPPKQTLRQNVDFARNDSKTVRDIWSAATEEDRLSLITSHLKKEFKLNEYQLSKINTNSIIADITKTKNGAKIQTTKEDVIELIKDAFENDAEPFFSTLDKLGIKLQDGINGTIQQSEIERKIASQLKRENMDVLLKGIYN